MTETLAFLRARLTRRPRVALILGSGLGALADQLDDTVRVPYTEIPGFRATTVPGHAGVLVAGRLEGIECVALQGRYHVYEGVSAEQVASPLRVVAALGARTLLLTSAAGAINPAFAAGTLMIVDDHINLMWQNPLAGSVLPGDERFPDMSAPYDPELQRLAESVARAAGIRVVRGVYAAVAGPSYETPAEIRMLARLGADAVGMSMVPEVLVARTLGMRVLGVSLISNAAAGLRETPLSHAEVVAAGAEAADRFATLIRGVLRELQKLPDSDAA